MKLMFHDAFTKIQKITIVYGYKNFENQRMCMLENYHLFGDQPISGLKIIIE